MPLELVGRLAESAWLVGGAVRDRLLGRPTTDYDIALTGDAQAIARQVARATRSHAFPLSEGFGGWRLVARDRRWQVDLLPLVAGTIEADLRHRDLTINAIAHPLPAGDCVDPFHGREDLRRRRLRMISPDAFEADPLRCLRLARLGCELSFTLEPTTAASAAASARGLARVAPERIFAELKRIVTADRALEGFELMGALGITDVVLPELSDLRGVAQNRYHHLDVYGHTMAVLAQTIELLHDPASQFAGDAEALRAVLAQPLGDELTRGEGLRFGALLHDIGKPRTRSTNDQGWVTFLGHDRVGAALARDILRRLRASERLAEYAHALTANHLRLGFLVHEMPLSRRTVYRYLRACAPVEVEVTLLSVADRLATRGDGAAGAIAKHVMLAREMIGEALAWRAAPPRAPVAGDQLAAALSLRRGPMLGQLLEELTEASFAGEITTVEEAIEHARVALAARRSDAR